MDIINIYIKAEKVIDETRGAGMMVFEDSRGNAHSKTTSIKSDDTPHRAKLKMIIELLKCLKFPCDVGIYIDDIGIKTAIEAKWYLKWQDNGYKTTKGKNVKDYDLWQELTSYLNTHNVGVVCYINIFDKELNKIIKEV